MLKTAQKMLQWGQYRPYRG